jgi:hypothetical protein
MALEKTTETLQRLAARLAAGLASGLASGLPSGLASGLASGLVLVGTLLSGVSAWAMELVVTGNTLVLSGPVTGSELAMVKDAFAANPRIDLVVLRNSHGGDAWTGYRVGELLREAKVTTAVSGYCISSCSRMFLGGTQRLFTSDYPPDRTYVGFHGHYNAQGDLDTQSVAKHGLYHWIIRHSDGKADPKLVERWIAIPRNRGAASFFHPDVAAALGHSAFFCDGKQPQKPTACEPLGTDALARGVITEGRRIASPDQDALPERVRAQRYPASGHAALDDMGKLPLDSAAGQEQYRQYLLAPLPRAFAVAPGRKQWAWNSGASGDAVEQAMKRCEERARQACVLYSVDDNVVYK